MGPLVVPRVKLFTLRPRFSGEAGPPPPRWAGSQSLQPHSPLCWGRSRPLSLPVWVHEMSPIPVVLSLQPAAQVAEVVGPRQCRGRPSPRPAVPLLGSPHPSAVCSCSSTCVACRTAPATCAVSSSNCASSRYPLQPCPNPLIPVQIPHQIPLSTLRPLPLPQVGHSGASAPLLSVCAPPLLSPPSLVPAAQPTLALALAMPQGSGLPSCPTPQPPFLGHKPFTLTPPPPLPEPAASPVLPRLADGSTSEEPGIAVPAPDR